MTFSATLDKTLRVYRASFGRLLAISVIAGVAQLPLMLVLEKRELFASARAALWVGTPLWFMLIGVITSIEHAAFARVLIGVKDGRPVGFRQAVGAALARVPTLVAASFMMFAAGSLGLLLLIVPGIYIFFGFSLSFMVIMSEGRPAVAAMKRSWALMEGWRGRVFGLVLVWGILNAVLSYAVGGALDLVGLGKIGIAEVLANQAASILISPCYGLSVGLVYYQLREQKEGHDLALAAQRLPGAAMPIPEGPGAPAR